MEIAVATLTDLGNLNVGPDEVGHSAYVVAEGAWYTAQFQGRGLDKWAAGAANDNDTALQELVEGQYPGALRTEQPTTVRATIAAGAIHSIPGPASGFVRYFDRFQMATATVTTAAVDAYVVRSPSNIYVSRAQSVTLVTGTATITAANPIVLGFGESLAVAPSAGDITLIYLYRDYPAADYTLVRAELSGATPVEIIPAPAAGYCSRIAAFGNAGAGFAAPRQAYVIRNDDTAACQPEVYLGADLAIRYGSLAAGSAINPALGSPFADFPFTALTGAVSIALRATVTTRPVQALLCYETIAL